jgi:hypothetical protein
MSRFSFKKDFLISFPDNVCQFTKFKTNVLLILKCSEILCLKVSITLCQNQKTIVVQMRNDLSVTVISNRKCHEKCVLYAVHDCFKHAGGHDIFLLDWRQVLSYDVSLLNIRLVVNSLIDSV